MLNFNKNKLINKTLDEYYNTFSHTLDTADFVPSKFNERIHKYIYKNMKKAFKKIDKEDKIYQKNLIKKDKEKNKKPRKQGLFKRFVLWLNYTRLKRQHRLLTYCPKENVENENCIAQN